MFKIGDVVRHKIAKYDSELKRDGIVVSPRGRHNIGNYYYVKWEGFTTDVLVWEEYLELLPQKPKWRI